MMRPSVDSGMRNEGNRTMEYGTPQPDRGHEYKTDDEANHHSYHMSPQPKNMHGQMSSDYLQNESTAAEQTAKESARTSNQHIPKFYGKSPTKLKGKRESHDVSPIKGAAQTLNESQLPELRGAQKFRQ